MLADHAELAREYVSEVENGKKELGLRALERIARRLASACKPSLKASSGEAQTKACAPSQTRLRE